MRNKISSEGIAAFVKGYELSKIFFDYKDC